MQLFQRLHKRSLGGAIYVCSIQRGHGSKSRPREFGQWMPDQLTENPICNPTDNGNYTEQQNLDPLHRGSRPMNFWWYNVGDDVVEYSATVQQQTSSPCPRWRNRRPLYCELDSLASTTYTLVQGWSPDQAFAQMLNEGVTQWSSRTGESMSRTLCDSASSPQMNERNVWAMVHSAIRPAIPASPLHVQARGTPGKRLRQG